LEQSSLRVRTDAFNVNVPKPRKVYQYRVVITGQRPGRDDSIKVDFNGGTIPA
jgi:hypothetical protein